MTPTLQDTKLAFHFDESLGAWAKLGPDERGSHIDGQTCAGSDCKGQQKRQGDRGEDNNICAVKGLFTTTSG